MTETLPSVHLDDEWLRMFYEQVGRELSLARESQRETHTWVITLTAGVFTAFLTFGGNGFNYPTENAFLAVLIILPLLFRFFVRSCLEYEILHRWTVLRNALDAYFFARSHMPDKVTDASRHLRDVIPKYYFAWYAARPFGRMLVDNIKLAYGWSFIVFSALLVWGLMMQHKSSVICGCLAAFVVWMVLELYWFMTYHGFKHLKPETDFGLKGLAGDFGVPEKK